MKTNKIEIHSKDSKPGKIPAELLQQNSGNIPLKVFIQEDDMAMKKKITEELDQKNYRITFFSKADSSFDLLNFNPDILITDYKEKKIIKTYEWAEPY